MNVDNGVDASAGGTGGTTTPSVAGSAGVAGGSAAPSGPSTAPTPAPTTQADGTQSRKVSMNTPDQPESTAGKQGIPGAGKKKRKRMSFVTNDHSIRPTDLHDLQAYQWLKRLLLDVFFGFVEFGSCAITQYVYTWVILYCPSSSTGHESVRGSYEGCEEGITTLWPALLPTRPR
jgi:hypothetical protein